MTRAPVLLAPFLLAACICAPGSSRCGDQCVDTASSVHHCGSCGNVCPGGFECRQGTCAPPAGACIPACEAGARCEDGTCVCDAGLARCSSGCVDLSSDVASCGACGRVCPAGARCEAGVCRCPPARPTACGDQCVDLRATHDHCGRCGHACPSEAHCADSTCHCPGAGAIECGGACVDGANDPEHCGACGNACALACVAGRCESVADIAIGNAHVVVRMTSGTLWSWGYGATCQLGDGCSSRWWARAVYPIDGITQVTAGTGHTCVIARDRPYCWGANGYGQLGIGTTAFAYHDPRSVMLSSVRRIVAGNMATCAVRTDRSVYCWGSENEGIVESPGGGVVTVPARWGAFDDVLDVALGAAGVCVRREGGAVHCSRLGSVGTWPRERAEWFGATAVVVADSHACALIDGVVSCYGRNAVGQLGNGSTDPSFQHHGPFDVELPEPAVEIALGSATSCARAASGRVYCWGSGREGLTGRFESATPSPRAIAATAGSQRLACGGNTCCVWFGGVDLRCWGSDSNGQLADGAATRTDRAAPHPVQW